ncbi:MAG: prolyl oligopeptidase family serine peptidase [Acidobacteriota bacterium]|jgi:prolyl oligopeptidase|nr:prolyl oligopeptidase family serine peptidase [Acidobacteriota bacterium]
MRHRFAIAILITLFTGTVCVAADEDPYLWLEEVESEKALTWAKERSDADTAVIEKVPEFAEIHTRLLEIYNSRDRIPAPGFRGAWIYNFWQDADHVRGVWRRTFLDEFVKDQPAWEIVLDLDALAEAEGENWVWSEVNCLGPDYRHCMIGLSRGGADATVVREFDTVSKEFVDGGFTVPEAKHQIDWMNENTLWVATDFGEGSLTTSGYPRIAKQWQRGTPLNDATTIFEASIDDVFAFAYSSHTPEARYDLVNLTPEFFRGTSYLRLGGRLVKIDIPEDAQMQGFFKNHMLVSLRTDWTVAGATYPQDALLAIGLDDFLKGNRDFEVLFEPSERVALDQVQSTRNHLVYTTLDNVHSRLYRLSPEENGWTKEEIELPGIGTVRLNQRGSSDSFFSDSTDDFFFTYTDFVTPTSLYLVGNEGETKRVKSSPEWFDATGMSVAQYQATSKDGTEIPYFVFMPKGFEADGANPTVVYAYGGFEVSRLPRYSGADGASWVARGGVYVLANIRGGGEFGPKWHQAAMQEKHQNNFDDLIAVAEDLIERKITSPKHLGIMGGSQGGLLVGGAFVQRPDLFNAVACAVPLLDMKRYNKLLAGASWMAEYGNPDTDDWDYIKLWSPYQNLEKNADYPEVFFWTNTRDDRVHPAHARKMVARMSEMGHKVYYYENTEGGHAAGANLNARAYTDALEFAYLWMKLR